MCDGCAGASCAAGAADLYPGGSQPWTEHFFLASGEDKREILREISSEPDSQPSKFPAGRIQPSGRALWFLDQAAAKLLKS